MKSARRALAPPRIAKISASISLGVKRLIWVGMTNGADRVLIRAKPTSCAVFRDGKNPRNRRIFQVSLARRHY